MRTITIATALFALAVAGPACGKKDSKKEDAAKVAAKDKDKDKDAKAKAEAAKKAEAEKLAAAKKAEPGEAPEMPKFGVAVSHEVEDFAKWKTAFDAHEAARKEGGAVGHSVSQDPENPNLVYVWLPGNDDTKLKEFGASDGLKTAMKEAGVKGEPKVLYLENLDMQMEEGFNPEEPLPGAMILHKVADYDKWKTAYDGHADKRKEAGILAAAVSRNLDDEKEISVWLAAKDVDALKSFLESEDLKAAMKDAGVEGEPTVSFMKPVEDKKYGDGAAEVAQK